MKLSKRRRISLFLYSGGVFNVISKVAKTKQKIKKLSPSTKEANLFFIYEKYFLYAYTGKGYQGFTMSISATSISFTNKCVQYCFIDKMSLTLLFIDKT